jgi:hypothetical protein
MQQFKNLEELKSAPMSIYSEMKTLMEKIGEGLNETGMLTEVLDGEMVASLPFMTYLGGDIFIIDNEEDLKEVSIYDDMSISELASAYDIAIILPTLDYAMFVAMTTDSGGATYFIPEEIYKYSPNILLSIILSNPQNIVSSLNLVEEND